MIRRESSRITTSEFAVTAVEGDESCIGAGGAALVLGRFIVVENLL